MSVATYITSIESSRNKIRNKLVELGMAGSADKLDKLAAAIEDIINQGAVNVTVQEGDTYTIPKGYHNGNGTVSGVSGGGNYTLQAKTTTPTKKQQNIAPDSGYYGLSGVTVAAIPDAYQDTSSVTAEAGDVLTGKVIVTADGTVTAGEMVNNGAVSKTLDATTITYTIPKGYHSGTGTVKLVLETKTVTPTKEEQKITPTGGKVLGEVVVNPIPDEYQDVSGVTATAEKVLAGSKFVDAEGNVVNGTMVDHSGGGTVRIVSLDPDKPAYIVPEGYHDGNIMVQAESMSKTVTPSKEVQYITGSGYGGYDDITVFLRQVQVDPIPDKYQDVSEVTAAPAQVLEGAKYVSPDGTLYEGEMVNRGAVSYILYYDENLWHLKYTIPEGYHNGEGVVSINTEVKTVTPSEREQIIVPSSKHVLRQVTVKAIPEEYADVSGVTAIPSGVLNGAWYVDSSGNKTRGEMPMNGDTSATIDGLTTTSVTIPAGHTMGGTVSLTNDIETALSKI